MVEQREHPAGGMRKIGETPPGLLHMRASIVQTHI